jgi:hypothetical protein
MPSAYGMSKYTQQVKKNVGVQGRLDLGGIT